MHGSTLVLERSVVQCCHYTASLLHPQKKKRTHVRTVDEPEGKKIPKSFVMERGTVGRAVSRLVLDTRRVMEPHTASKLKVSAAATHTCNEVYVSCMYTVCEPFPHDEHILAGSVD